MSTASHVTSRWKPCGQIQAQHNSGASSLIVDKIVALQAEQHQVMTWTRYHRNNWAVRARRQAPPPRCCQGSIISQDPLPPSQTYHRGATANRCHRSAGSRANLTGVAIRPLPELPPSSCLPSSTAPAKPRLLLWLRSLPAPPAGRGHSSCRQHCPLQEKLRVQQELFLSLAWPL